MAAKNKYAARLEKLLEARQMIDGQLPLELLVECYQNPKHNMALRVEAASRAATYVHRKMPVAVEVAGAGGVPLSVEIITPMSRRANADPNPPG